jgi:tRNA (guanine-N7-)-methyltransferase
VIAPASPSLVHKPENIVDRFDWGTLFPVSQPVELELGSGDGSFLLQWAQSHPETNFCGVERLLGRLRKLDRKGLRAGLRNLRVVRLEAAYLLQYLVPPASLRAIHVYFPDPWPKRKHLERRLINTHFTRLAATALTPAGHVWMRTDNQDYFEQMKAVFGANEQFEAVDTPSELSSVTTDFERYFNDQGIPTLRAGYRLKGPSDSR